MFNNAAIYTLPSDFTGFDVSLLAHAAMKPIGPQEGECVGLVSPFGPDSKVLALESTGRILLALGRQERVIPSAVIKAALEAKVRAVRQYSGRNPGKKKREQLQTEVMLDLMPRAFIRRSVFMAYICVERRVLVVNSPSTRVADDISKQLRLALGTFACEPLQTEESVAAELASWLSAGSCGETKLDLGDGCTLADPVDAGSTIKASRQDLHMEEIKAHLATGKRVTELALIFDNRLSFYLNDRCQIRGLKMLDIVLDETKGTAWDSIEGEIDVRFTLLVLELDRLFDALNSAFRWM